MRYLSVCSGIEAATVAWHPLGFQPVAFSEIDAFPCAVLKHHYPDVPNWGDLTKFREWPDADVDVLVGGTPCQSFSVAGLRAGMADPRGNLALTYIAVARRYRPRWVVWENVPGVLSSDDGRAFGSFLSGLAGWDIPIPEGGWQNSGIVNAAPGCYGLAWGSLDAQYSGLAQRRLRVFVVGHLGDWRRAAAVLFECESLSGHPAPRHEARQEVAGSLGAGSKRSGGRVGRREAAAGHLVPSTGDISHCLNAGGMGRIDYETETLIAHSLRADGFDASEDGTGRGTPIVPIALFDERQITSPDNRMACRVDTPVPTMHEKPFAVAFSAKDHGADAGELAPTLRAGGYDKSHANGGVMPAVAHTLGSHRAGSATEDGTGRGVPLTPAGMQVRRLTPRECERLQGFTDDYTLIPYRGKPAADGPRYKALGNSMAVPVMRWIGSRIALVDALEIPREKTA